LVKERYRDISTVAALQNYVAATEERVKYNKGDEQFDIGPGIGNLRLALSRLRAPKVDHRRADQRCQASG